MASPPWRHHERFESGTESATATPITRRDELQGDDDIGAARPLRLRADGCGLAPTETMARARRLTKVPRANHFVYETVAIVGASVGVALGAAFAWPIGMIAGGALGLVGGLLAGKTIEVNVARAAARDQLYDDEEIASTGSELVRPGAALRADHARIERVLDALVESLEKGAWGDARARLREVERRLAAHVATEEADLFPRLRETQPDEVDALLREHAELRLVVSELAGGIGAQLVRRDLARKLVELLRAHGAREGAFAYRWADASLSPSMGVDVEMSLDV